MEETYVLGIDFGTLSGRAAIVRVSDGLEKAAAVYEYPNAVMDDVLSVADGQKLPADFALQNPRDYIEVLKHAVPEAIAKSMVDPAQIKGIGIDFTSATVIAAKEDGTPLCDLAKFTNNPHAYVKLWKHHGAQEQADRIVALAKERGESWLARYGGILSAEMLLPKVLETYEKAPEVYADTDVFVDALDWIVWRMTGNLVYSAGDSGYKRNFQDGTYPCEEFLELLSPGFGKVFSEKMPGQVLALGAEAGKLTARAAAWMGLEPGISVATGNIDAHVTAAAVQAVEPGQLTAILGTSACYIVSGPQFREVPGMFGCVDGGVVDGLWGFEAGQSSMGDVFAWYLDNALPHSYVVAAEKAGISIFELLAEKARAQEIGEHGLVALDWFSGNRSILVDSELSGAILGITMTTKPEDIYRALVEATCFGARTIIESFTNAGVKIDEIVASGGLIKDPFFMQTLADITCVPLSVATTKQGGALGAAAHGAVAAGFYPSIKEASLAMGGKITAAYVPNYDRTARYDELFNEYRQLHDYFGRGENEVMHRLKDIRRRAVERKRAAAKKPQE